MIKRASAGTATPRTRARARAGRARARAAAAAGGRRRKAVLIAEALDMAYGKREVKRGKGKEGAVLAKNRDALISEGVHLRQIPFLVGWTVNEFSDGPWI